MKYLAAIDPKAAGLFLSILRRELGLSWKGILVLGLIVLIIVLIWNSNQKSK